MTDERQDSPQRQPLVAGNWKMHGSIGMLRNMVSNLLDAAEVLQRVEVLVLPPYPYLAPAAELINGKLLHLGAQNLSQHEKGAYTGEVSASMLLDIGCEYVLVGHSERRALYHEDDELVAEKFVTAQRAGLVPIVCLGETLEQHERDLTEVTIRRQLDAVIDRAGVKALERAVLAYEPVWAIGTGQTATPEQAQAVHAMLRETIRDMNGKIAESVRILYGGSVKPDNAADLFDQRDIDGGLIGGASLIASEFLEICDAVAVADSAATN